MQELSYKACRLEVKSAADNGQVEGYGSVFGNIDATGDIIEAGAFRDTLRNPVASPLPMLWQHWPDSPIGAWHELSEDKHGLKVKGQITVGSDQGRNAHALLKDGAINGLSIGFNTLSERFEREGGNSVRVIEAIELWEVSLVTYPANRRARVTDVKRRLQDGGTPTARELEQLFRCAGLSKTDAKHLVSALRREADDDDQSNRGGGQAAEQLAHALEVEAAARRFESFLS